MECRNCTGNEFKKTLSGNYKCLYCGTLYYEERIKKQIRKNRLPLAATAAAVILIISALIAYFSLYSDSNETSYSKSDESGGTHYLFNKTENLPEPSGEIISLEQIPDSIGSMYFLALYKNTGKVALRKPQVTVRLFSETDEKIATGSGYGFKKNLNPGEETPVYILVRKCPPFTRYETVHTPDYPYIIPEEGIFKNSFRAEITHTTLKQGSMKNAYILNGRIYNRSSHNAKFVQVAVIIYNRDQKAIGYTSAYINEKNLEPGDYDLFRLNIYNLQDKPDHYKIYYDGNID